MVFKYTMILLLVLLSSFIFLYGCGKPDLRGFKKSSHFNGETFFLPNYKRSKKGLKKMLKWRFDTKSNIPWPHHVENKDFPFPQKRNDLGQLSVTFINHATCLVQLDGVNIVTDPIWSERASPLSFAGPKRVRKPGIDFKDLPKIDVIIISHNHYDHMDLETIDRIVKRDGAKVIFGLGNSYYLSKESRKNSIELDWQNSVTLNEIEFTLLPSRHWSKRTFNDTNKSLWAAFAIVGKSGRKVYFAGDTGYSDHFKKASEKFGAFDLSLIPIGAYEPRWFMKESHINPEEAFKAHIDLDSQLSIGIHHRTFKLTDEAIDEPLVRLNNLVEKYRPEYPFISLEEGETRSVY